MFPEYKFFDVYSTEKLSKKQQTTIAGRDWISSRCQQLAKELLGDSENQMARNITEKRKFFRDAGK